MNGDRQIFVEEGSSSRNAKITWDDARTEWQSEAYADALIMNRGDGSGREVVEIIWGIGEGYGIMGRVIMRSWLIGREDYCE